MRRGSSLRVIRPDPLTVSVSILAICFCLGGLLGCLCAGNCDTSVQDAFRGYLSDYCIFCEVYGASVPLGKCFLLYFTTVCAAFVFGYSSLGVMLIPFFSAVFGFLSYYTVFCFAFSFGRDGILLAAALTFVRLFFTLPCFLIVASQSLIRSFRIALLAVGHGKRLPLSGGRYLFVFVVCLFCLCVGVLCERFLTPILFRAAIDAMEFIP